MSQSEILYVKGMVDSESDGEEDENIWDDKKLNDAYDKALKMANAEVAKRIAMATNTQVGKPEKKGKKNKSSSKPSSSKKKGTEWKVGMPCRAIYDGDGLEYEAYVLKMFDDEECIVRFIGYENSELVSINTLKPTLGNDERARQMEQALNEKTDDGFGSQSPNLDRMEYGSDRIPSPGSTDRSFPTKKTSKKKKKHSKNMGGFELPDMPLPMPNISMLRNLGSMEMPMPPPPMSFSAHNRSDSEEQAVSSMLISWYMSGYYTGLYQGMKRAKENRRNM
ncbi:survival motor neuron protein isoform X2 [Manduca sexta]|uniref:survival motor neuron protein isoform X2 n=2 Tax=Manduca sexta TaxID=7130 RepID=UPI00188FD083|nr:survival motor neuron protein isoform X2 [Manduca sexta]